MRHTVVAYGEILWDLLPTGAVLGGAPFNFVYRVNSLGGRGVMISRLGRDELGERARRLAAELGVDTRLIQRDEAHPTGTVPVCFDPEGNPDFTIVPDVGYDYIQPGPELDRAVGEAQVVCFGTLVQRSPVSRDTLRELLARFRGRWVLLGHQPASGLLQPAEHRRFHPPGRHPEAQRRGGPGPGGHLRAGGRRSAGVRPRDPGGLAPAVRRDHSRRARGPGLLAIRGNGLPPCLQGQTRGHGRLRRCLHRGLPVHPAGGRHPAGSLARRQRPGGAGGHAEGGPQAADGQALTSFRDRTPLAPVIAELAEFSR